MGRPRGSKNTAMVNGRITADQMQWLEEKADELGGNLSAALRQALTDSRVLEAAREDFLEFLKAHPEIEIPFNERGVSYTWFVFLTAALSEPEDIELREQGT